MYKKHLKMVGLTLLYITVYFIIAKITSHFYFQVWGEFELFGKALKNNVPLFHLFFDLFLLPGFILVFALKKENLFKVCKFKKVDIHSLIVIFIIGFTASLFTASFIQIPWVDASMPNVSRLLYGRLLDQHIIQFLFWMPLHCAFIREVLYRGILFNELKKVLPFTIAIILHGLFQGFLYFQFQDFGLVFYSILGATIFALVYSWCDSLWASIFLQIVLESFLFLWKNVGKSIFTKDVSPFVLGCSMLLIISALVYLKEYRDSLKE